jgi:hypothetical protein
VQEDIRILSRNNQSIIDEKYFSYKTWFIR